MYFNLLQLLFFFGGVVLSFFFLFFNFNFLLLFNYSCMPFLPIPPPHLAIVILADTFRSIFKFAPTSSMPF